MGITNTHPDDEFARHKKALDNQKKIEEALKEIKELEECCFNSNHPQVREMYDDVRRIKEILESGRKVSDIDKNN